MIRRKVFTVVLTWMASSFLMAQAQTPAAAPPASCQAECDQRVEKLQKKLDDFAALTRFRDENAALPAMQPGRVVFFGDSITEGWGRHGTTFFPGKPYVNRGISGQTTEQMLIRFRQDVIDLHPEAVVILAGTNDVAGNTGPTTNQMIEDNFASMAELAKANGIRVVLASVLPAAKYPWRPEIEPVARIHDLNQWIEAYCTKNKLTYLDYYSHMANAEGGMKDGISKDGVHPNAAGYAIMTPLAEAALVH